MQRLPKSAGRIKGVGCRFRESVSEPFQFIPCDRPNAEKSADQLRCPSEQRVHKPLLSFFRAWRPTTRACANLTARKAGWSFHHGDARLLAMSTIAEIEAAIEHLPAPQVEELANWLELHRARRAAPLPADAWLTRARGAARPGVTTAEVMALTRGDE